MLSKLRLPFFLWGEGSLAANDDPSRRCTLHSVSPRVPCYNAVNAVHIPSTKGSHGQPNANREFRASFFFFFSFSLYLSVLHDFRTYDRFRQWKNLIAAIFPPPKKRKSLDIINHRRPKKRFVRTKKASHSARLLSPFWFPRFLIIFVQRPGSWLLKRYSRKDAIKVERRFASSPRTTA